MEFGISVPGFSVCSIQCLVVQVQKKIPIWPFSSRLGRSEISHWQAGCRISSKTTGRIILDIGQNVSPQCLVVQEPKPKSNLSKNMAAVGHLWFFLLSHRLRIEWNLLIRLASMSSWILVKWWNLAFRFPASLSVTIGHHAVGGEGATPHSNPQIYILGGSRVKEKAFFTLVTDSFYFHIRTNLSHVWRIRTYLSYL